MPGVAIDGSGALVKAVGLLVVGAVALGVGGSLVVVGGGLAVCPLFSAKVKMPSKSTSKSSSTSGTHVYGETSHIPLFKLSPNIKCVWT